MARVRYIRKKDVYFITKKRIGNNDFKFLYLALESGIDVGQEINVGPGF
jgi:hypothetical protein